MLYICSLHLLMKLLLFLSTPPYYAIGTDIAITLSRCMYVCMYGFSSVQFAKINVVLSAKHFRTTTQ